MTNTHLSSFSLLFALLNPFLMSIYLIDLITDLTRGVFLRVLARGAMVSGVVFWLFAWGGDAIFSDYLQLHFASFQIFGGAIFLMIGIRFVFAGVAAIRDMRGKPEHIAGSIAMPFMIGPGTISASVVIGARHNIWEAGALIFFTLLLTVLLVTAIKLAHDTVKDYNARIIDRYIEVVGRISALLIGTIAVEMVFEGVSKWTAEIASRI